MNIFLNWDSSICSSSLAQRVEYKKVGDTTWTLHASIPCGIGSTYINNLDDDTLYEFRVGAMCGNALDSAIIYTSKTVQIKINCVLFDDLVTTDSQLTYTFTGNAEYDSYDVVLLSEANVEITRNNELYAATITGSFTGLTPNTNYKVRIEPITYFDKFVKTNCPAESFTTEDIAIPDCSTALFDIIFVNDESASVGSANFRNSIIPGILEIVRTISQLVVDQQIRIALKGFASSKINRLSLSDDYDLVFNTIKSSPFAGGATYTSGGLRLAYDELLADTRDVPSKVILITDGVPNLCGNLGQATNGTNSSCNAKADAEGVANLIKGLTKGGQPVELITMGVANADNVWLSQNVASSPQKHYVASNFSDFQDAAIDVSLTICANIPPAVADPCDSPTDVVAITLNQPNQTCIQPSNVNAQITSITILCNKPTNVIATLRETCNAPGSVSGMIL